MNRMGRIGIAALLSLGLLAACGGGGSGSSDGTVTLSVAEAISRDAHGVAIHLGEMVTTEGVVTVSAGVFANNKLKVFMQDGGDGIMVYHQSAADVDAFQAGDRLRLTGIIRQADPTSDSNPANGTILIDISAGSWTILSRGSAIPAAQDVTLAAINTTSVGALVRVAGVQKVEGDWPPVGSKSTQVTVSDDGGATTLILRLQKNTITPETVAKLDAIGDAPFQLVGIVIQDDGEGNSDLVSGFEIWIRGADDVEATT